MRSFYAFLRSFYPQTSPQPAMDHPADLVAALDGGVSVSPAPTVSQSPQPAAIAVEPAQEQNMSFLSAIGKSFKSVFNWIASPKGQAVISTGDTVIETIDPQLTGIIDLANSWMEKVITTESLAAAAGSQAGTGAQKAAAVLAAMQPEIAKYFPAATAAEIASANTAIVAFLNAFSTTAVAA